MLHKRFNFMILVRIKQYALYISYKFFILPNFKNLLQPIKLVKFYENG